jgi:cystathionine gamma-synthase
MKSRTPLLKQPLWTAEDLGQPIPNDPHGVSVALPCWDHVIGYEENREDVSRRMTAGYPRFWIHRAIIDLVKSISNDPFALPLPSEKIAEEAVSFIKHQSGEAARVQKEKDVYLVVTSKPGYLALEKFWQHSGMIVSSRQAMSVTQGVSDAQRGKEARAGIRATLAKWYHCAPGDIYLHPTGMGSLYTALRAVMTHRPNARTIQLGFPYVDTLKIQEKFGTGALFISETDEAAAEAIRVAAEQEDIAALFCEVPTNPMLMTPNLALLQPILAAHDIPLVVDDTIATPFNVNVTPYADLIMTSLTKHLTGSGTVMGGALICNPQSPRYAEMKRLLESDHEELFADADAIAMEPLLEDFPDRMRIHNRNGQFIAEKLKVHPTVEQVWYPEWECRESYDAVRTPEGGYGSLITFLTKNPHQSAAPVYDALEVCKGPSLGTNFTLASPFTLLAHYQELDWAAQYGVLSTMIRISIGLEDPEELWHRFEKALSALK